MKAKIILLLLVCGLATQPSLAQVPNGGFENWTNFGSYQDPLYWGSTNSFSTGSFHAITQSIDNYPTNVGVYSVRIENNISLLPNYSGRGFLSTGPPPPGPDFPVTGHHTSLTGYYKFAPLNGDTMLIQIQLYNNGSSVSYGQFATTAAAPNWTSFTIPVSPYTTADSASIFIAAYYANGFNYVPHGNSVLYVDNLNFDVLINDVQEINSTQGNVQFAPNPFSTETVLKTDKDLKQGTISIYNTFGQLVKKTENLQGNNFSVKRDNLPSGIYTIRITEDNTPVSSSKLVITD